MDSTSNNNINPESSGSKHSRRHSTRHSHNRHHSHSSRQESGSRKQFNKFKRHRLEDEPARERLKKIEKLFSKNILSIFSVIFIAGAIWFGIETWNSTDNSFFNFGNSINVEKQFSGNSSLFLFAFFPRESLKSTNLFLTTSFIVILSISLIFILVTLGLSIRYHNILLKMMSFLAWIILAVWLFASFCTKLETGLFYSSIVIFTVFFGLFFSSGFIDPYAGRSRWKFRLEYMFILINSLFYFYVMMAILNKSGHTNYHSFFIFLLSTWHLVTFYYTDKLNMTYNKVPYLIASLIITCFFLPIIIKSNFFIVFLAPLSVFLILFSKYSRNQTSVLFSLIAMLLMVLVYFYQWSFKFIPDIAFMDGLKNTGLFIKGLISGLFIVPAFVINNRLLKRLTFSFSIKWLSKGRYLKFIKGTLLLLIYLFSYWVFNYFLMVITKNENLSLAVWFSFNCLYFMICIPSLARQRSSFFRLILILAIISSFTYITFIHFNTIQFRTLFVESHGGSVFPFLFHFIPASLLVLMLLTLLRYFKRAFPGKKTLIKGFWVYFFVICIFIVLSEYDHLSVLLGYYNGIPIKESIKNTTRIGYSLLMIISSLIVLVLGFTVKSRFLRLFSLIILAGVMVKILVYDMGSLAPLWKMILFFILGFILLMLSIFYPKIKTFFFKKDTLQSNEQYSDIKKHRS